MSMRLHGTWIMALGITFTLLWAGMFIMPIARGTGSNDSPQGGIWLEQDVLTGGSVDADGVDSGDPSDDDSVDWWRFNGTGGTGVDVDLWIDESSYPSPEVTLGLYGPDNANISVGTDTSDEFPSSSEEFGLHISANLTADGVYYIKVSTTDTRTIEYYLHWDCNMAYPIDFDTPIQDYLDHHLDDYDIYYFNVSSATTVNITLDMEETTTDFDLYLYNQTSELDKSIAGTGYDEYIEYTLPSGGIYYIYCIAYEYASNNFGNYTLTLTEVSGPQQYPDLTVTDISPTSATVNQSQSYSVVVANQGSATAPSPIDVRIDIDGNLYTTLQITQALSPGANTTVSFAYTFTTTGSHIIDATVDPNDNITESNEANNALSQGVSVSGQSQGGDDDPSGANSIALNTTVSDSVDKSTDQVDWWKFNIPTWGSAVITLSWSGSSDLDLYLYSDPSSSSIDSSSGTSNPESISQFLDTAGTYYIKVYAYSTSAPVTYTLNLTFVPGEGDDMPQGATDLPYNTTTSGAVASDTDQNDWYKVNIPQNGIIDVLLTWGNSARLYLYLYDSTDFNNALDSSTSWSTNVQHIEYVATSPGYYYIKVYASSASAQYNLTVNFTTQFDDDFYQGANALALNSTVSESVDKTTDEVDWWRFSVTTGGTLDLSLSWSGSSDLDLYLYDDPTASYIDSSAGTSNPESINKYLTQGTYYIKVRAYSSTAPVNYQLSITFTPGYNDNDPSGAIPIGPNATVNGNVSYSGDQVDWYKVNITTVGTVDIILSWPGSSDLDLYLYDDPSTSYIDSSAGYSNPESISHQISTPQWYYIKVKAYSGTENYQLSLSFTPYVPGQGPDLTVLSITPTVATVNQPFGFTVTIKNIGQGDVTTSFDLAIYIDSSTYPDYSNTQPSLTANTQTTVSFSHTFTTTGQHTITAVVDDGDDVLEDDETNNELPVNVQVNLPGQNNPPTAVISLPSDGGSFTTKDTITFDGSQSTDPDGDTLTYLWESSIDGIIGQNATFQRKLTAGSHTITLTVDDGNGGSDTATINITVTSAGPNNDPTITVTEPDGQNDIADDKFFIKWSYNDPDGDPCTVDLYYDTDTDPMKKDLIVMGVDASKGMFEWDVSKIPNGNYYIFALIKDSYGGSNQDYSDGTLEVLHNTPPVVSVIEPDGMGDNADTNFTITWSATDSEQDPSTLIINLYYLTVPPNIEDKKVIVKGTENDGAYTWDTSSMQEGDYMIYIEADDGKGGIGSGISKGNLHIEHNTPPTAPTNLKPQTTHELRPRITWTPSTDADGDMITYVISMWEGGKDGELIVDSINLHTPSFIPPHELSYGDDGLGEKYYIEVYAVDSNDARSDTLSALLNVVNTPPTAPTLTLTPEDPKSTDTVTCEINAPSQDEDGDAITYKFQWYRNGELFESSQLPQGYVKAMSSTLLSVFTTKGENWRCVVTPYDGVVEGEGAEISFTVGNTPPTAHIAQPADGAEFDSPEVTLDATGSEDQDGDTLSYTWYVDGKVVGKEKVTTVSLEPGSHEVKLEVSDGEDVEASVIQIGIRSSYVVVTSVYVSATNIVEGDSVNVLVKIKNTGDAEADSVTVVLHDGESEISKVVEEGIAPNEEREVVFNWEAVSGEHTLYAYIEGNPIPTGSKWPVGTNQTTVSVAASTGTEGEGGGGAEGGKGGVSGGGEGSFYIYLLVIIIVVAVIVAVSLYAYSKHVERKKEEERKRKIKEREEKEREMMAMAQAQNAPPPQPLSQHPYEQAYYNYLEPQADPYSQSAGYYMPYPTEAPYLGAGEQAPQLAPGTGAEPSLPPAYDVGQESPYTSPPPKSASVKIKAARKATVEEGGEGDVVGSDELFTLPEETPLDNVPNVDESEADLFRLPDEEGSGAGGGDEGGEDESDVIDSNELKDIFKE